MLETDRLILRRFTKDDTNAVFSMRSDAEIMRFIREPQKNRNETLNWIQLISGKWESERLGFCAVARKESGKMIGWCGLWRLRETDEIEVGYAISRDFWHRGFASEAAEAFLKYGFEELSLKEIVAVAHPENQASQNVMKKIGMSYDYTDEFYGRDLVHYSITREEFLKFQRKDVKT